MGAFYDATGEGQGDDDDPAEDDGAGLSSGVGQSVPFAPTQPTTSSSGRRLNAVYYCYVVSHAPDSLRESLVLYSRAVRSGLE